jgi:hypothetical protein
MQDQRRIFASGVVDATRDALIRYRREFTVVPWAVIAHPDDVAPNPPHLHGLVVVRSASIERGTVRVVGPCDNGMASIDR